MARRKKVSTKTGVSPPTTTVKSKNTNIVNIKINGRSAARQGRKDKKTGYFSQAGGYRGVQPPIYTIINQLPPMGDNNASSTIQYMMSEMRNELGRLKIEQPQKSDIFQEQASKIMMEIGTSPEAINTQEIGTSMGGFEMYQSTTPLSVSPLTRTGEMEISPSTSANPLFEFKTPIKGKVPKYDEMVTPMGEFATPMADWPTPIQPGFTKETSPPFKDQAMSPMPDFRGKLEKYSQKLFDTSIDNKLDKVTKRAKLRDISGKVYSNLLLQEKNDNELEQMLKTKPTKGYYKRLYEITDNAIKNNL